MSITIRRALPEDAYTYADCHFSCWRSAYKGIVPDEYLDNLPSVRDERAERYRGLFGSSEDPVFYCVTHREEMIGFVVVHIGDSELLAIYLLEEFWNKGYGKEMLNFALNEFRSAGCEKVSLWVFEDNIRARKFYERNGFVFNGAKKDFECGEPLTAVKYVLNSQ